MIHAIHTFMMAGSPPHYQVALGVLAYAILEFWLGRTKVVQSNSSLELAATLAKKALLDRIPLIGKLVKAMATPTMVLILASVTLTGCPLSTTPAGATTAQKLKADMDAIAQIELDVKTQCGANFAPLAVQAGAALSIAEAAANAYAGNIAGAVGAAATAYPALAGDAQGIACVVRVLQADYQKYKPHSAAWLMRAHALEQSAARAQLQALIEVPPVCDTGANEGPQACRKITVDDDVPASCPMTEARADARPALVRR